MNNPDSRNLSIKLYSIPFHHSLVERIDEPFTRFFLEESLYEWLLKYVGFGHSSDYRTMEYGNDWWWDWKRDWRGWMILPGTPVFYCFSPQSAMRFKLSWGGE